jgi:FkbM family methyltransferase
MKRFIVKCFEVRGIERFAISLLRPVRKIPGFASLWLRLKWMLCAQSQGRDIDLRWATLPVGSGLYVHPGELVGAIYFERDSYEPTTTRFVMEHLKQGQTFIDIGANYGYFTMLAAALVGESGKVVAFEANPKLQKMVKMSSERNGYQGRIFSADIALSDTNQDKVTFFVSTDPNQTGISTMHPWQGHIKAGNLSSGHTITVKTVRFDDWAQHAGLNAIHMIKLDVEGAELQVLRGMGESLKRFKPRYIVSETLLDGEVSKYLGSLGYSAEPLELLVPKDKWGNILFVRYD